MSKVDDQPRRPDGKFGHKVHSESEVILDRAPSIDESDWQRDVAEAQRAHNEAIQDFDAAQGDYRASLTTLREAERDAALHDSKAYRSPSERREQRRAVAAVRSAKRDVDAAREAMMDAAADEQDASGELARLDAVHRSGAVAPRTVYRGPDHVDDTVTVETPEGRSVVMHRVAGDIRPYEPQLIRVQVNKELSSDEAERLANLVAYQYTTTGGGQMGSFTQDSPNSITIHADTTHRYVDGKAVATSRSYRQVHGRFSEGLPEIIREGSPVRKTNRAGEGTKGTRKFEALADVKPEIYVDSALRRTPQEV